MKPFNALLIVGLIAAAVPAGAQRPQQQKKDSSRRAASAIPADSRPPKGMCRIWLDGVPAAQQPAATDCPTAIKNRPTNGRVIFGDELVDSTRGKSAEKGKISPNIKGFTEMKRPPVIRPKRPPGK
jgi:hypothetical protein